MNKQYFLLVKSFTDMNSRPVEHAIVDKLTKTLDQTVWNKGIKDLEAHLENVCTETKKEFNDQVNTNMIDGEPAAGTIYFLSLGLFKITAFEVRNAVQRWHVQMPMSWMPLKYKNWPMMAEVEKNKAIEAEMQQVLEVLKASDKTLLFTTFSEKFDGWQIRLLDFGSEALKTESGDTSASFGVTFKE